MVEWKHIRTIQDEYMDIPYIHSHYSSFMNIVFNKKLDRKIIETIENRVDRKTMSSNVVDSLISRLTKAEEDFFEEWINNFGNNKSYGIRKEDTLEVKKQKFKKGFENRTAEKDRISTYNFDLFMNLKTELFDKNPELKDYFKQYNNIIKGI